MNCQPSDAELNTIQQQKSGNCDEEIHDENDLLLHEGFRNDPNSSSNNKLSSNKNHEKPTLEPGPVGEKKQTEDETEEFLSCEYCEKTFDNKLAVLECYTRHFKLELKNVCKSLLDSEQDQQQCPFCSEKFEHFDSLTCHLGTVHLLVNDFLIQEGVRPLLPSNEDYETYLDSLEI